MPPQYRNSEQLEIIGTFTEMLLGPTGDGGGKRLRGEKPSWKADNSHWDAAMRHIRRYDLEREREDADSGVHPLIHAAWRLLAVAWQDDEAAGKHPASPDEPDEMILARQFKNVTIKPVTIKDFV